MGMIYTTEGVSTSTITATGDVTSVPARILSMYIVGAASAGSVVLKDSSGGATLATINTPAGATLTQNIDFGSEGLNFKVKPNATLTNIASVLFVIG